MTPEQQAILDRVNARLVEQQAAVQQANARVSEQQPPTPVEPNLWDVFKQGAIKGVTGVGDILKARSNYRRELAGQEPIQSPTEFAKEKGWIVPENDPRKGNFVENAVGLGGELLATGGLNPFSAGRTLLNQGLTQAGKQIAGQFGRAGVQTAAGAGGLSGAQSIGIDNPLALAGATMLPMAGAGILTSLRSAPSSIAKDALSGVSPQQLKQAQMLQEKAVNYGSPLTAAESIAQVAGSNPLQGVQRVVEQSRAGGPILAEMMNQRPALNADLINRYTANMAMGGQPSSQIPIAMQDIANQVVKGAESSLTAKTSPYYQSAGKTYLPEADLATITSNPKIADAINAVTKTSDYGVKGADPRSVETLIQAKHYLSDQLNKQLNAVTGAEKNAARVTTVAEKELSDFLKSKSPDYAKGSSIYQNAQQTQIQPLKQSGVGVMAEQAGTPEQLMRSQREVLMPTNPAATFEPDIIRMADLLRRKDPYLVPEWTGQNIKGLYNEAAQNLPSGLNQFGAPKFVAQIAGNPQQKANLMALVEKGAGPVSKNDLEEIIQIFGAQGKRQPAGSMTEFNRSLNEQFGAGGVVGEGLSALTKPSTVRRWYENYKYGQNTEELAKLLRSPEGVKTLVELAKTAPESAKGQALINTIIGGLASQENK